MQNGSPQKQDFIFTLGAFDYCIGYQDDEFETFAMSTTVSGEGNWGWVVTEQLYGKSLAEWGDSAVKFLEYFLARCNEYLMINTSPEVPEDEWGKLIYTVEHGLQFSKENGVELK